MKKYIKAFYVMCLEKVLLAWAIATGNNDLFENIVFKQWPTKFDDQSVFDKEVESSKEKGEKKLNISLDSIENYDDIYAIAGIQFVNNQNEIKNVYQLKYKTSDDKISLEVIERPCEANAVSIKNEIWTDLVKFLQRELEPKIIQKQGKEKLYGIEVNKLASEIAFETRRGAGNTIIISKNSLFEESLRLTGLMTRCIVSYSDELNENELIIGYRGSKDIDCGLNLTLTNEFENENFKYDLELQDNYFKRLYVNLKTN